VRLPQLVTVGAVVGGEVQRAADIGQAGGAGAVAAGVDVLDHDGAGGGAVRLPQLLAVGAVGVAIVGRVEQGAVDVGQEPRIGAVRARIDVVELVGACAGAVGPVQLGAGPTAPAQAPTSS